MLFTISGLGTAVLAYSGGLRAQLGGLTIGDWYLFLQGIGLLWFPLTSIASFWSQFQLGLAAGERVFALIDAEPQVTQTGAEPVAELSGAIELRNVTFHYKEGEQVFEDFSLSVHPRRDAGAGGPHRLRQVEHHQAGGALLRVSRAGRSWSTGATCAPWIWPASAPISGS